MASRGSQDIVWNCQILVESDIFDGKVEGFFVEVGAFH